jgi:hypothetical protein
MPKTFTALSTEIAAQQALTAVADARARGALAAYVELVDLVQLGFNQSDWSVIASALEIAFPASRALIGRPVSAEAPTPAKGTRVELVKPIEPGAPKRLSLVDPKADGPKAG